jgi:hypothetical protein
MKRFEAVIPAICGALLFAGSAAAQHTDKTLTQEMNQEAKTQATRTLETETTLSVQKGAARPASWKIQNAMDAAPRAISKNATVVDWPAAEGGEMPVLRQGTNDWTCLPDDPTTPSTDPTCMDKMAKEWAKA